MNKHYTASDLDFSTFVCLNEGIFSINFKEPDDGVKQTEETVMFINIFDKNIKPDIVVMYKNKSSMNYSVNMKFSSKDLNEIFAAIIKFFYVTIMCGDDIAQIEMG